MAGIEPIWYAFGVIVTSLLLVDIFVINRPGKLLTFRAAAKWSMVVVATALAFAVLVWNVRGSRSGLEYLTGYLIEMSLSVDNLFVFLLVFQYFAVPPIAQPKVLNYGVFGAMAMRGIMIVLGILIIRQFSWVVYILGLILLVTGIKMFRSEDIRIEPESNPLVRAFRRYFPIADSYDGAKFFTHQRGKKLMTPLVLVVVVVEWTDVMFAIDSVPAIFSITTDPFIVYSSNIFAILGLRSMFFVLAEALERFVYLKAGVALILTFVGLKMLVAYWYHIPIVASLATIGVILTTSIVMSMYKTKRAAAESAPSSNEP